MIIYKGYEIKKSLLSNYFRVYEPNGYLYPNTFWSVASARKFIDIIKGDCQNDKK